MARSLAKKWACRLGDVTAAFLQAELDGEEMVFVIPPESEFKEGEKK